ncbi:NAD(P)-binding protein [Aspergillus heteromorphus CBS 117.55]|uniref:NAD(P)-binding protein n=1 Tax=Aspergillus heteromorphus CBS 117.55 TaxID=1448321 RepID=A0A317X5I8_9EURO|nr:NAD(P)-binding protein [Aspergillus heteromorphus CBS 117.55]PWY92198.1 NAD(P)-binding protein [Aspergillus heteromorphus CBS 117.55]
MNPINTTPYSLPPNATWLTLTSVTQTFSVAAAHFGPFFHIDVLVNNTGYSLAGDTEPVTEEQMHDELETLFFGTVRVAIQAVRVRVMRSHPAGRGGVIFNISSVAGVCAFPGHASLHCSSKFAVEGWTEAFAREMKSDWNEQKHRVNLIWLFLFTVNFCLVEPGSVKTNVETTSKKHIAPHEAYAGADMPARQLGAFHRKSIEAGAGAQPEEIARVLYTVASRGEKIPLHLPLSETAVRFIGMKLKGRLEGLEEVTDLSGLDVGEVFCVIRFEWFTAQTASFAQKDGIRPQL